MKRIIEDCNALDHYNYSCSGMSHEGVKLRLRGKGSGFLEGPEQMESHDPLNLCVSSKDKVKYLHACRLVEKLLERVYTEFRFFDKGKMFHFNNQLPVKVKKEESITGPKSLFESSDNKQLTEHFLNNSSNSGNVFTDLSPVKNQTYVDGS